MNQASRPSPKLVAARRNRPMPPQAGNGARRHDKAGTPSFLRRYRARYGA